MQKSDNYELEYRGPLAFSHIASLVLLLSMLCGVGIALLVTHSATSSIPILATLVGTGVAASVIGVQRLAKLRKRRPQSAPRHLETGATSELMHDITEYLDATPSLVGIVCIEGEERVVHLYDNQAASRFLLRACQ
jgi:hypothetical protein